ncbi:YqgE/AlgH family protein [Marinilabiliaceae bacterium ANBcel2]|nr:YqgE/AlgH family protein [Marinilabiliaceae bacterium ANBcel2]
MKNIDLNIFKNIHTGLHPAKGRVLIAEPFLEGPYFSRSIILLTEHTKEGSIGFVLNKATDIYPDEIIEDLLNFRGELFVGGPVASNTLHFIHTLGKLIPGSKKITSSIYWGGSFEDVKELINEGTASRSSVRFFAGYSGWAPGQLEHEIAEKSWIVASLEDAMIMDVQSENLWRDSLSKLGSKYKTWTNFPSNPTYN